jgi:cyclopropane-fatty-acyl-phospholipid synthase
VTLIDVVQRILSAADIKINGDRPWDITVHNERFYRRVLSDGLLGVGESYMDGDWDCKDLHEAAYRALRANIDEVISQFSWRESFRAYRHAL